MISTADERPVFYDGCGTQLAGILTVPRSPNGLTVMLPWGGGAYPSSGKNRIRTNLARAVAEEGYHAFRFDYHGVGESGGDYTDPDLSSPYVDDILDTARWLVSEGLDRIILVGSCFGAYSALLTVTRFPGLEGLAMVRAPVRRDHKEVKWAERSRREWAEAATRFRLRHLADARRRAKYRKILSVRAKSMISGRGTFERGDSLFSQNVSYLLNRRIPLLFIYSKDDHFHQDLVRELTGGLGMAFEAAAPAARLVLTEERLQGFATLTAQEFLVSEVLAWLRRSAAQTGGNPGPEVNASRRGDPDDALGDAGG